MPRPQLSRRRFLALVAAGSTAAAGDALAATTPAPRTKKKSSASPKKPPAKPPVYASPPAPTAEIAKGIAQQKEWLAASLETIRRFELPPGSEQAFAFRPLPVERNRS